MIDDAGGLLLMYYTVSGDAGAGDDEDGSF